MIDSDEATPFASHVPPSPVQRPSPRVVATVAAGTLLNPLNSSMIAVALLDVRRSFHVTVANVTWLISAYALAAAIGQPVMGRLADRIGARRVFLTGVALVGLTGTLAPLSPRFEVLVALRVLQAFGTSSAFPAGLALLRHGPVRGPHMPAGALGVISVTANVSAAFGPYVGGILVRGAGWPAIFVVNVPAAILALVLGFRWLPEDTTPAPRAKEILSLARAMDPLGIALFAATVAFLLGFLVSVATSPHPIALALAIVCAIALFVRETRVAEPFLDVRSLARQHALLAVYGQFVLLSVVFYAMFFALPMWLEQVHHVDPRRTGMLMLPFTGVGIVSTVTAVPLIRRIGPRPVVFFGALVLVVAAALFLRLDAGAPESMVVAIVAVAGIPNGFTNLGLQSELYASAAHDAMASAAGLFQMFRYVGSALSTSLLALAFAGNVSAGGFRSMTFVLITVSAVLCVTAALVALRRAKV